MITNSRTPLRQPRGSLATECSEGAKALDGTVSPILADAIERGHGRIECEVLGHPYLHLAPLVGSS